MTTSKGEGDDYLNCPFTKEEYHAFIEALVAAEQVPLKDFEKAKYFEGCMPIEEIARRGKDSLRFGNFKPVGLEDPRTGPRGSAHRAPPLRCPPTPPRESREVAL